MLHYRFYGIKFIRKFTVIITKTFQLQIKTILLYFKIDQVLISTPISHTILLILHGRVFQSTYKQR